jgi:SAM-dependent methyltransferase
MHCAFTQVHRLECAIRALPTMNHPLATTIHTYDERAAFFVARGTGDLSRHFALFATLVPRAGLVLDVGCGPGWHALELERLGLRVAAFDLSRGMLAEAQKMGLRNIATADMRQLPVPQQCADGIWACASFLHVPRNDSGATLREFHRVLRLGGVLYLSVKGGSGERYANPLDGLPRYFVFWTEVQLDAQLWDAGFAIIDGWNDAPMAKETRADVWIHRFAVTK